MIISVYALLMLVSLLVSLLIYRAEPTRASSLAMWVWITSLLTFFAQGLADTTGMMIPLVIAVTMPNWIVCVRLVESIYHQRFRIEKVMLIFFGICLAIGSAMYAYGAPSQFAALPVALGTGIPYCVLAVIAWKRVKNRTSIDALFFFNLLVAGINILDYPFLRFIPEFVMFGFSVAFFNSFVNAILIPVVVTVHIRDGYEATLKKAVTDATDELNATNNDLVQAKNEIQNLLRVVCHDISNSLMVADFSVGKARKIITEQDPAHAVIISLEKAASATANVRSLVENVRFLQKFSAQNVPVKLEAMRAQDLVETSVGLLSLALQEKSIEVTRDIRSNEPLLGVKTYAVNSVLNNLLSNAIKFSYLGATIAIKCYDQDPYVVVEISDRGIGIAPEVLPNVFSPAQSASTVGTAGEVGTGFGLPIVKAVMEIMGGEIEIDTRHKSAFPDDHGTTVILKFKMARHEKKADPDHQASTSYRPVTPHRG